MIAKGTRPVRGRSLSNTLAIALLASTALGGTLAYADDFKPFKPGHLLLSRSVYDSSASLITAGVTQLPPGCGTTQSPCVTAVADGAYPTVFNNDTVDGSFGVTAPVLLDEMTPGGDVRQTLEVSNGNGSGMVTSFSSKSEVALNLSVGKDRVSFMGYLANVGTIDVSNANTPFVIDPTNPVTGIDYRVIASVDQFGHFTFTKTNAYSGNNGRAAILNDANGASLYYTAGNAGNGGNPQPAGIIVGGGAQIMTPSSLPLAQQPDPGLPTPVGSFSITELGFAADKVGKDTNFRGLTVFNNVVYLTKGSGGNGVNTVYFIDTTGSACTNGVGVPSATATLPTGPIVYNAANLAKQGVTPYNMCILRGFPTSLAKATTPPPAFPFGIWFANATTLYVADEGDGTATYANGGYTDAAAQTTAGLQKWVLDTTTNTWSRAYTLQAGLDLGVPYTVKNYPSGLNTTMGGTGQPWSPATDGLRNITGKVNGDGTVTIYAITSTVSGSGDQGADPNKLVMIKDKLKATKLPADESFVTVRTATSGEVLRGVSFTPGTGLEKVSSNCDGNCDQQD